MNKGSQNYYAFYIVLALLAGALVYFSLEHPMRKANLFGVVESPKISIDHPRKALIESVKVSPGQRVTEGETLMELSSIAIEDDLESLAFAGRQMEANQEKEVYEVEIEKNELALAFLQEKMKWEQASRELEMSVKRDEVWLKDISATSQPDSLSASYWKATLLNEEYKSKLAELELREKLLNKKKQLLESTFEAGKEELEIRNRRLLAEKTSLQIKAPASGTVDNVYFMEGQTAEGFSELLSLLPDENKFVRAYITEQNDFNVNFTEVVVQSSLDAGKTSVARYVGSGGVDILPVQLQLSQVQQSGKEIFFKLDSSEGWLQGEKVMIMFK